MAAVSLEPVTRVTAGIRGRLCN